LEVYLILPLSEVVLEDIPLEGLTLNADCIIRLVNDGVRTIADTIKPQIGEINVDSIKNAGVGNCLQQISPTPMGDEEARRFLLRTITLTQQFLLSLWLVKDNSGNTCEAHLALHDRQTGKGEVYSQHTPFLNVMANCERTTTTFTREEVERAVGYYRQLEAFLPQLAWKSTDPRPSGLVIKSRLYRAIYSAQLARANAELGVKIAFYCIAFEALFSTDREAISHRIAERAAILIEADGVGRKALYQDLKKLYGIRSTVVHGDVLNADRLVEFRQIAQRADAQLRTTIQRIFADEALLDLFTKKSKDAIDTYFLDRLFP